MVNVKQFEQNQVCVKAIITITAFDSLFRKCSFSLPSEGGHRSEKNLTCLFKCALVGEAYKKGSGRKFILAFACPQ